MDRHVLAVSLAAFFCLLFLLETLRPLRRRKRSLGPRLAVNISVTALSFAVGIAVVRPVALGTAAWTEAHTFGLLPLSGLPFWGQAVLGFLLMDLTFYYWHRANHVYPVLWRFHNVHHVDPDLDVSTSFRFHFGETLYSSLFRLLQVGLLGIGPVTYLVYEVVFNLATGFHHSNLRLPLGLERALNRVLVTPRMHGVHHSAVGPETNANYAVIFRWWDFLHNTLKLNIPQHDIVIGVPGYLSPADNRLWALLAAPLVRQRPYWRWPSGKAAVRKPLPVPNPAVMAP